MLLNSQTKILKIILNKETSRYTIKDLIKRSSPNLIKIIIIKKITFLAKARISTKDLTKTIKIM